MDPSRPLAPDPYAVLPQPSFDLASNDVADGRPLPGPCTGPGGNASPHLGWEGFPASTSSFLVTCFDPDAPGDGFWHWAIANLPASTTSLPRGAGSSDGALLPAGALQARNDAGTLGYTGAAPPRGDRPHRYFFAVHALDVERLDVAPTAGAAEMQAVALPHTIARAVIVPTFQR